MADPFGESINLNNNPFGDFNKLANPFEDINDNNQSNNPFGDDFPQGNPSSNKQQNIFDDSDFPKGDSNNNTNFNNNFSPFTTPTKTNNNPIQHRNNNPPKIIPTTKYIESPPPQKNLYTTHKTQILTQLLPQLTTSLQQDNLTQTLNNCTTILSILSNYNK